MNNASIPNNAKVLHLEYIDGFRGLCALYIVCHHLLPASGYFKGNLLWLLGWGGYCVAIFITISGFCLMLPVVRNGFVLRNGCGRFFAKRARRILPPYYVALLISIAMAPVLTHHVPSYADLLSNQYGMSALLHLVLLHNWFDSSKYMFNGPLWSVAVECQIYILFPLLVLLLRKLGPFRLLTLVAGIAIPLAVFLGYRGNVHYVLLFTIGMSGPSLQTERLTSFQIRTGILLGVVGMIAGQRYSLLLGDISVSVLSTIFLTHAADRSVSWLRTLCTLRPLRTLGLFSYSVYLVHSLPLIYLSTHHASLQSWSNLARYVFCLLTVGPIALSSAYLFFLVVEKPFMTRHQEALVIKEGL